MFVAFALLTALLPAIFANPTPNPTHRKGPPCPDNMDDYKQNNDTTWTDCVYMDEKQLCGWGWETWVMYEDGSDCEASKVGWTRCSHWVDSFSCNFTAHNVWGMDWTNPDKCIKPDSGAYAGKSYQLYCGAGAAEIGLMLSVAAVFVALVMS